MNRAKVDIPHKVAIDFTPQRQTRQFVCQTLPLGSPQNRFLQTAISDQKSMA
jgi:hypothetical protein